MRSSHVVLTAVRDSALDAEASVSLAPRRTSPLHLHGVLKHMLGRGDTSSAAFEEIRHKVLDAMQMEEAICRQ